MLGDSDGDWWDVFDWSNAGEGGASAVAAETQGGSMSEANALAALNAEQTVLAVRDATRGEWAAVQAMPQQARAEAVKRPVARSTMKNLRSLLRFWKLWIEKKQIVIVGHGPTWEQVAARDGWLHVMGGCTRGSVCECGAGEPFCVCVYQCACARATHWGISV